MLEWSTALTTSQVAQMIPSHRLDSLPRKGAKESDPSRLTRPNFER
jgi:hypothetical protein